MRAKDLKAGDLFTTAPQAYWDHVKDNDLRSIGQEVQIRSENPCTKVLEKVRIYKVTITKHPETLAELEGIAETQTELDFKRSDPRA